MKDYVRTEDPLKSVLMGCRWQAKYSQLSKEWNAWKTIYKIESKHCLKKMLRL